VISVFNLLAEKKIKEISILFTAKKVYTEKTFET